jgi:catechol 2,3-dioxygenase-like lactoylglutathione lyase family enzyme
MSLGALQHYTIEPSDLERTKDFHCDVLGLQNGDRPPLNFPGYWLYSGGVATVHLMGQRQPREGIVVRGTEKKFDHTGRLNHIAFAATDLDGVRKRLQSRNVKFREQIVPRSGETQIFLYDPDDVGVELNFPALHNAVVQRCLDERAVRIGISNTPDHPTSGSPDPQGQPCTNSIVRSHDRLSIAWGAARSHTAFRCPAGKRSVNVLHPLRPFLSPLGLRSKSLRCSPLGSTLRRPLRVSLVAFFDTCDHHAFRNSSLFEDSR